MPNEKDLKTVLNEATTETFPEFRNYVMTYRHGMSPFCMKGFKVRGDLRAARDRAFAHGKIMGYKNIWVMPQIVDLDAEEKRQLYSGESILPNNEQRNPVEMEIAPKI